MGPFSLLLVLLLLTRSPFNACLFTGSLYLLLRLFSFEPVPSRRGLCRCSSPGTAFPLSPTAEAATTPRRTRWQPFGRWVPHAFRPYALLGAWAFACLSEFPSLFMMALAFPTFIYKEYIQVAINPSQCQKIS